MTVLAVRDLTIRVGGRTLLDGASLAVDPGRKLGLVGRNGAGKSTLMRTIVGELAADGGEIRLAARARMAYLAQEAPSGSANLLETVLAADHERAALLTEAETGSDPHRVAEIHDRLVAIGADVAPARAAAILAGLGFDTAAQARPVGEYSGGWRMRVALARALFVEPDLLLLDEPTNHLDLEATLWLEGWLARFAGAAIVISHDRGLLERCVNAIAHLDRGRLTLYSGNFSEFVRLRTERVAQLGAERERVAGERARIQAFVDRFRAKASKARQAQSRVKALERMPALEAVVEDHATRFAFPEPAELAPPVVALDRASAGYGGVAVLAGLNLRLDQEDRIALLGANGNGKSTLAKLLAGRMDPIAGEMKRAPKLKVGYFAQHQEEELDPRGTPLTHMQAVMPKATIQVCRAQLARFGLDVERAETAIGQLSGGEKARLLLALCTRDAPQLLILDEPTNHLDIDARDAMVKALAEFGGAVVLITHDPHLVELVADQLWLVADGTVRAFDGDLDEYRALLLDRARAAARGEAPGAAKTPRDDRRGRAENRAAQAPLRDQVRRLEARLAELAREAAVIDAALADPRLYSGNKPELVKRASARRAAITREVEAQEAKWLAVSEQLDAA